jgi:uncharacterized protein UPF0047
MRTHTRYLTFETPERRQFVRITDEVQQAVEESGVAEGMVLVSAMHITAGVWVNDDEPGILEDTLEWLDKLAPPSWREPANEVARGLGPDTGRTSSSTIRSCCRSPAAASTSGRGRRSSTPSSTAGGASGW